MRKKNSSPPPPQKKKTFSLTPKCTTLDPTHDPSLACVSCSSCAIALPTLGAACTRCNPCPVSVRRYRPPLDAAPKRSSCARHQSLNMSLEIERHSASVWRTYANWRACEWVRRAPATPPEMARESC